MAGKYLGDEFDIHGGGIDLRFPHHENELAQSRAAGRGFARYWLHNAWVTAAGEKMSKSLGNGLLVTEVTSRWPARAVRLYLIGPHYRSTIEFSDAALDEATTALARVDSFVTRASTVVAATSVQLPAQFAAALDDDLGTPAALAALYERVREGNRALDAGDQATAGQALSEVTAMLDVFGLRADDPVWATAADDLTDVVDGLVSALVEHRAAARDRKDYAAADAIRDQLTALGLTIEDTPTGPRWTRG
jgi:cysteinyl-tRNA synthetase